MLYRLFFIQIILSDKYSHKTLNILLCKMNLSKTTNYSGIEISDMCLQTCPCQHNVKYDNISVRMYGTDIYRLFRDKKLPIPSHFNGYKQRVELQDFEDNIDTLSFEEIIKNDIFKQNINKMFNFCIRKCKFKIIDYIISNNLVELNRDHLIECAKNPELFQVFVDISKKIGTHKLLSDKGTNYVGHGGETILSMATYHNNLPVVKFLVEEIKVDMPQMNPLFELKNLKDKTKMRDYFVDYTLKNNLIINDRQSVKKIINTDLYNVFIDAGLVKKFFIVDIAYNNNSYIKALEETESIKGIIDDVD